MNAYRSLIDVTALNGIGLTRGSVMRIENGRGRRIEVQHGTLWITQDGDIGDVVIEAGEAFRLNRDGTALLTATGGCALTLITVEPRVARTTLRERFTAALRELVTRRPVQQPCS
jgi:hypothetical protein